MPTVFMCSWCSPRPGSATNGETIRCTCPQLCGRGFCAPYDPRPNL